MDPASLAGVMPTCTVIGLGQLGRLFGAGALASGHRTTPVRRGDSIEQALADAAGPIVVTVGEAALPAVLKEIPRERHGDVVLVQNELLPDVWRAHLAAEPTVAVVWSNVKKGRPIEVGRATHVHGAHASFVSALHEAIDVPCVQLVDAAALEQELVAKYAFILGVNALGLEEARTVGAWLDADPARVDAVLARVIALADARTGRPHPAAAAIARAAMEPLRAMPAAGRTARERVERARALAIALGVPAL